MVVAARVLVVDDDDEFRQAMVELLGTCGYATLQAPNGLAGLELAAAHAPDVIVLDYRMPLLDGVEVFRRLRACGHRMPIVLVTAAEPSVASGDLPFSACLRKPFDPEELLSAMDRALGVARP